MACVKLSLLLFLLSFSASAQTFSEWFRQKSTQKKYLTQQIAALQVYSGYLSKGYDIAKGGLGSIGGYIGYEFSLHQDYYDHLQKVNIVIKSDPRIKAILQWQADIIVQTNRMKLLNGLSSKERSYTDEVCKALLNDCDARLNDLQVVLEDGKTKMADEERVRQLGRLHTAMQDNYSFSVIFLRQLRNYVDNKGKEQRNINSLRQLYERP